MLKQRRNFRTGTERHANHFATNASRSNIRYSLSETHATPDGHTVKQIGEHTWLIEKARKINGDEPYIEIICMDSEAEIQKAD